MSFWKQSRESLTIKLLCCFSMKNVNNHIFSKSNTAIGFVSHWQTPYFAVQVWVCVCLLLVSIFYHLNNISRFAWALIPTHLYPLNNKITASIIILFHGSNDRSLSAAFTSSLDENILMRVHIHSDGLWSEDWTYKQQRKQHHRHQIVLSLLS